FTYLNVARARLAVRQSRFDEAAFYLQRAAGLGETYLSAAENYVILTSLFGTQINAGQLADGIQTYARMRDHSHYAPSGAYDDAIAGILALRASPEPIGIEAVIPDRDGRT